MTSRFRTLIENSLASVLPDSEHEHNENLRGALAIKEPNAVETNKISIALRSKNTNGSNLTKALHHPNPEIRAAAMRSSSPHLSPEHTETAFKDSHTQVIHSAILHSPHATAKHLTPLLSHKDENIRAAAVNRMNDNGEKIPSHHLNSLIQSTSAHTVNSALENKGVDSMHVLNASHHPNPEVRIAAASHEKATADTVKHFMNEPRNRAYIHNVEANRKAKFLK